MAIGLVSEEIFSKMLFFSQGKNKFFFQKIKKCYVVDWIHMNVGRIDLLQSNK